MTLHERDPVPETDMLMVRRRGSFTICQKLREIFALATPMTRSARYYMKTGDDPQKLIRIKSRLATAMAKAMQAQIKEYRKKNRNLKSRIKKMTKLSIITPVLNSHKIVRRQLRHYQKMNLPNTVEIIFIDDGSTPPLIDDVGLKNFQIIITNDYRPWTHVLAKNIGVKESFGEYVFLTDIDHILPKRVIYEALAFTGDKMEFPREFAILNNRGNIVQDLNTLIKYGYQRARYKKRKFRTYKHTSTFVMRKEIFNMIGGFRERIKVHAKILEDSRMYKNYQNNCKAGKCKPSVFGSMTYVFPASGKDPLNLFHDLER